MSRRLYNSPNIKELLFTTENQNYERKSALIQPKALAAEFSAFANSSVEGGLVVLGIEKDEEVIGINSVGQDKINKLIQAQRVFCSDARVEHKEFPIVNSKGSKDRLLFFYVEFSPSKVIKLNSGEVWERLGDQTCEIKLLDKIRQMEYDKREADFEKELIPTLTMEQLNKELLDGFIKKWIERDGLVSKPSTEDLILTKGFGQREQGDIKVNYAGALLFYDKPGEFISGAKIRFFKYEGIKVETGPRSNIIKDRYFEGPIVKQIEGLVEMVRTQIRELSFLGTDGKFKTVLEYPEFAWYEAIVNAVVHRAYNLKNANIFVKMFDDRLEIQCPGNLPGIVTVENIYQQSFPRNPVLMQALLYFGYVKSAGEGVDRMRDEMQALKLPEPEFQDDRNAVLFTVVLKNNIENRVVKDKIDRMKELNKEIVEILDKDEKEIIYYIFKNQIGAPADFGKEIGKGRATVVRKLRHLEELRAITRTKKLGRDVKYKLSEAILNKNISKQFQMKEDKNGEKQPKLL